MWEWLERIFGQGFMPQGDCYLWSPPMVWTQACSNLVIGGAYASIACTLAVLLRRIANIRFAGVYLAFGTFILSCGLSHFFDVIAIWHPIYWADAGVRVVSATASVATAVLIVPFVPRAVAFADSARLSSERARQLEAAHSELEKTHELLAERARRAQHRALMSEERFRSLVETMPQLCWISGPDGKCTFRNRRWQEYSGLSYDDPDAAGWRAVYAADAVEQVFENWKESVDSKEPFEFEARIRRADGEYRWFLMRALALCDDAGTVLSWMGTCTDVHDRRLLHEDALRTAKMKDEFLATVSHELRTPLNAIIGWAHLLKAGNLTEEKAARALESVENNALAQARLVDDLIDLSRIVAGKMRLDPRLTAPAEPVEGAFDTVRHSASAKGIDLIAEIDHEAGLVMADAGRLQQIVWNLLGNAIKFTPRGGRVSLQTKRVGRELLIVVSDSGVGIKRDFLPRLFERFSQEDGSSRRNYGGLGLGLAITKQLVELHGGEIQVDSAGEGRGATFTVKLPLAAPTQTKEASSRNGAAEPELRGLRLLLVEDDLDSREVVSAILADFGVNVTSARNAEEALRILARNQVDVIVSDVGLPGMDGHAFMREVRRKQDLRRVPALALTAYAYVEDRQRALDAGFQMHLRKPFTHTELLSALGDLAKLADSS